jgi:YggT family protein
MNSLLLLIDTILSIYIWLVIGMVISSWLVAYNVINTRNRFVYMVVDFLYRITEPALKPIRKHIPKLGGFDLSPVVLLIALWFLRNLMFEIFV